MFHEVRVANFIQAVEFLEEISGYSVLSEFGVGCI